MASKHYRMLQIDVKAAFLNGVLKEELYMLKPKGFVMERKQNYVYRLRKAIYGLKQASGRCEKHLHALLTSWDAFNILAMPDCTSKGTEMRSK